MEIDRLRRDAQRVLAGELAVGQLSARDWHALAEDGPLHVLLLEFFDASEAWEAPGPTRVAATESLWRLAPRLAVADDL